MYGTHTTHYTVKLSMEGVLSRILVHCTTSSTVGEGVCVRARPRTAVLVRDRVRPENVGRAASGGAPAWERAYARAASVS